jgi:hypothetical protein
MSDPYQRQNEGLIAIAATASTAAAAAATATAAATTPAAAVAAATSTAITATSTTATTAAATTATIPAATAAASATRRLSRGIEAKHVRGLGALRFFDDIELNFLTFVEDLEAIAIDCAVVNEYVRTTLALQEAVALFLREPLDGTIGTSHRLNS